MSHIEWLLPIASPTLERLEQSNLASIRLRSAVCVKALLDHSLSVTVSDGEQFSGAKIIVVGKPDLMANSPRHTRWLRYIEHARRLGARILVDYTDHHLGTESPADHFYSAVLHHADMAICSSMHLAELLRHCYTGQVCVIEDPIEVPITPPQIRSQKRKTALWFGHASNLPYLMEFLCESYAIPGRVRLLLMTNACPLPESMVRQLDRPRLQDLDICVLPWNLPDMLTAAGMSDVCWIPAGFNSARKAGASSNRLLTAFAMGLPVAADVLASYLPLRDSFADLRTLEFPELMAQPESYFERVLQAQAHIAAHCTMSVMGAQWVRCLKSLLAKKSISAM